ncbi:MAG TPA: T9SS type A sorting domain-containing protein, partial [Candidatus Cloacimonas sp.]|nr:T9SS type A sorting domain-containing protein [Candidatus Cloacimonas sp.]
LIDNRFPWETPNGGKSAPLLGEFSPASGMEILYLDVFGNGYVIGNDGETLSTFSGPANINISRSFAFGAIDTDAGADLAFTSRNGDIYAKHINGGNIFRFRANTSFLFTPVLADLDGDGYSETIAGGLDGKLYVVHSNGYFHLGFPLDLGSAFHSELAAADFNDDGLYEIVAGTSEGKLFLIDGQGIIKPGFPLQLNGPVSGAPTITNNKKIVCATASKIYIIDQTGSILATRNIDTHIAGGFALADLSNDNWGMDIVGVSISGKLYAITDNGNDLPGFPVQIGVNFTCPPLIANLDSDPEPEILLHSYVNSVYGYNHDGSPLSGFPFITTYNGSTPATLADFDGNNQIKLVMGHSNGVLMLNLRRDASGLAPWTTYRGSSLRQGSFASTGFVSGEDQLQGPLQNALQQNYPNPFNPSTTLSYSLAKDAQAKVEIYNLKGQRIVTLFSGVQKSGNHSLIWNGRDESGRSVASGIYFSRLSVAGKTYERRMLLLK